MAHNLPQFLAEEALIKYERCTEARTQTHVFKKTLGRAVDIFPASICQHYDVHSCCMLHCKQAICSTCAIRL
jgi:hypothetical protein